MPAQTKLVTYDDYRNLPDDGKRYEIIKGELYMTASPLIKHQLVSQNLESLLNSYLKEHNLGTFFHAPMDVVLSMTDVVQPDILFISKERLHIITEKNIVEAPDLVAEITSESTRVRDQTTKKALYQKYGVKEYWIVYPGEKEIEQFTLQDETFELKGKCRESETLDADVISGFSIDLKEVFAT